MVHNYSLLVKVDTGQLSQLDRGIAFSDDEGSSSTHVSKLGMKGLGVKT